MHISKNMEIINSLDDLKILTFWKIAKNNDFRLLDANYNKRKKYTEKQISELEGVWAILYDEYWQKSNDNVSKAKFKKSVNLKHIELQLHELSNNFNYLLSLKSYVGVLDESDLIKYEQETYERLKKIVPRIKPKIFDGIDANLDLIKRFVNGLQNSYNREKASQGKAVNEQVDNVYKIVANAESWLERNLNINEMVVSHWLAIQEQVKAKAKAQQKQKRNGK